MNIKQCTSKNQLVWYNASFSLPRTFGDPFATPFLPCKHGTPPVTTYTNILPKLCFMEIHAWFNQNKQLGTRNTIHIPVPIPPHVARLMPPTVAPAWAHNVQLFGVPVPISWPSLAMLTKQTQSAPWFIILWYRSALLLMAVFQYSSFLSRAGEDYSTIGFRLKNND